MEQYDAIIIGAGLTGLTTAHYLNKNGLDFQVLEQEERPGGVIQTRREHGFVYEQGPNTGVLGTPEIAQLFEEISDKCELEVAGDEAKKRYVLKNGRWHLLPSGITGGIRTPLFAFKDKLRLLGEPFRKPGTNPQETLAELVKRRMGKSFLNYAIDPFILGVYAGDPHRLVPRYALPKLYNLEQNYGSFIGGAVKKRREPKSEAEKKATRDVFSVKGGLENLTNALYESAGKEHFLFNAQNTQIKPDVNGFQVTTEVNGQTRSFWTKQVVTATDAHALPQLLPFVDAEKLSRLTSLVYARVVEVVLGFNKWKGRKLEGFGGLIPHLENRDLLGVLFMSAFLEGRAPEGGALLTIFMGGVRRDEIVEWSDKKIKEVVTSEIQYLMELEEFNPDLFRIKRYHKAIPQYMKDSGKRFAAIEELQAQYPGLHLGGNMLEGIGMADRVKQGKRMANAVKGLKQE